MHTAFTREELRLLISNTIKNLDNQNYETVGGNDTDDKVFLLSIGEAEQYFSSDDERLCKPTRYALSQDKRIVFSAEGHGCWWLRSPGGLSDRAALVWQDGSLDEVGYYVDDSPVAVRPALWLNLES